MDPHRIAIRYASVGAGALLAVSAVTACAMLLRGWLMETPAPPRRMVQQITLVAPPPPPPKVQEPPPEPQQKQVDLARPKQEAPPEKPADVPPPGKLGLDAKGGAGSDGFGLAARKGGRDLIGAAGGSRFGHYASALQRDVQAALDAESRLRTRDYSVVVRIWLRPDGGVRRVELSGSTGRPALDRMIVRRLSALGALAAAPPPDMPQPLRLRISSRM